VPASTPTATRRPSASKAGDTTTNAAISTRPHQLIAPHLLQSIRSSLRPLSCADRDDQTPPARATPTELAIDWLPYDLRAAEGIFTVGERVTAAGDWLAAETAKIPTVQTQVPSTDPAADTDEVMAAFRAYLEEWPRQRL
jgi:hypothetical protein